jgi:radical SAM modification target selenobiotic family peptide
MEVDMDKKELKKLLAGLSVASLIAGASLTMAGCATG